MYFQHSDEIWSSFPGLVAGALFVEGISTKAAPDGEIERFNAIAAQRLSTNPEGELPEIQAWRRAFTKMGLKATQYRCASESLLRRFRKEGSLPRIHPLIDVCNSISLAFALPIAVFDTARIDEYIEVRPATGDETYLTFSDEIEHPEPGEVIFADAARRAHARRWTNRQSRYSAVSDTTSTVLIVAEAMHESASDDVGRLTTAIIESIGTIWPQAPKHAILSRPAPQFKF